MATRCCCGKSDTGGGFWRQPSKPSGVKYILCNAFYCFSAGQKLSACTIRSFFHSLTSATVIEIFARLGFALLLSLSLALLMAWGWHHSDQAPDQAKDLVMVGSGTLVTASPH